MNLQQVFCTRLKTARKERKLTQEKLGIIIGLDEFVASTRINRYEKGVHQPDFQTLSAISSVLDIPVAYLFTEDDELANKILEWSSK